MMGSGSSAMAMGMGATQAYGEASYWDKRYSKKEGEERDPATFPFDWYQKYPSLAPLLHLYVPPKSLYNHDHRFLVVGCGNSAFSEDMVKDGYCNISNIDISSVVIQAMQKKYSTWPQLTFMTMDVRDMSAFEAGSFDAVVDKGTLDSILCGHDSLKNATKMLEEVERVLKDGGIYFLVTYGAPIYRLSLLRNSCSWAIKLHIIDKIPSNDGSGHASSELTSPVPLDDDDDDDDGSSVDSASGKKRQVHYIYVCIKDNKVVRR